MRCGKATGLVGPDTSQKRKGAPWAPFLFGLISGSSSIDGQSRITQQSPVDDLIAQPTISCIPACLQHSLSQRHAIELVVLNPRDNELILPIVRQRCRPVDGHCAILCAGDRVALGILVVAIHPAVGHGLAVG